VRQPLLFVGDVHLGRSSYRLAAAGLDPSLLGPAEAWRRVVRYATSHDVQAVVLAGDLVDQDKDRFEAWGHLQRGVEALISSGVRVLGVAGNHDHIALPRLADRIGDFALLGAGATWELAELDGVDLVGWSFPTRHHRDSPLASPGLSEALDARRADALTIGVLHADLDASGSPYASVRRAELAALPVAAWFLGHIHQPQGLGGHPPLGYLGSLVGLDRGETGARGPWLVRPESASTLTVEQLALGPVYWTEVDVDLSELSLGADAHDLVHSAIESGIADAAAGNPWLADGDFDAVGCSVSFTGRVDRREAVRTFIEKLKPDELVFETRGRRWAVVHMSDRTHPRRDLHALEAERTPLGQIAGLVAALDAGGRAAIPAEVLAAVESFDPAPWSGDLDRDPLPNLVEVVRAAGLRLIDQLLAQSPRDGGP
jgi:DNA repair protein SbcD/Mre11